MHFKTVNPLRNTLNFQYFSSVRTESERAECADLICLSICKIFNCSLTTGIFPDDRKCAKVTPLFKQGSSSDMNNYRSISVISVVAKVVRKTKVRSSVRVPIRT